MSIRSNRVWQLSPCLHGWGYETVSKNGPTGISISNDGIRHTSCLRVRPSIHAEASLMLNIKDYIDRGKLSYNSKTRFDIIVIRVNPSGMLTNSKPCCNCVKFMEKMKLPIKNIYYSNSSGSITRTTLQNLIDEDESTKYITRGDIRK